MDISTPFPTFYLKFTFIIIPIHYAKFSRRLKVKEYLINNRNVNKGYQQMVISHKDGHISFFPTFYLKFTFIIIPILHSTFSRRLKVKEYLNNNQNVNKGYQQMVI